MDTSNNGYHIVPDSQYTKSIFTKVFKLTDQLLFAKISPIINTQPSKRKIKLYPYHRPIHSNIDRSQFVGNVAI